MNFRDMFVSTCRIKGACNATMSSFFFGGGVQWASNLGHHTDTEGALSIETSPSSLMFSKGVHKTYF